MSEIPSQKRVIIYRTIESLNALLDDPLNGTRCLGYLNDLEAREEIPSNQTIGRGKWYMQRVFVVKGQGTAKAFRLVLTHVPYPADKNVQLFVTRQYFRHQEHDHIWDPFRRDHISSRKYHERFPLDDALLEEARAYCTREITPRERVLPQLSSHEANWLKSFQLHYELSVFETPTWVRVLDEDQDQDQPPPTTEQLRHVHALLCQIWEGTGAAQTLFSTTHRYVYRVENNHCGVVFERNAYDFRDETLLLHGWYAPGEYARLSTIRENARHYQPLSPEHYTDQQPFAPAARRNAYRGYPDSLLRPRGADSWILIQNGTARVNLALSNEQVEFLKDPQLPRFVNGQAGSGKTVMLLYLFAGFYHEYYQNGGAHNLPLFLTENSTLLRKTREAAQLTLRFNERYAERQTEISEAELHRAFFTFSDLLRSLLPVGDPLHLRAGSSREEQPHPKFVDYHRFRSLYLNSQLDRTTVIGRYPPELCWYVINAFVRGYNPTTSELTPERFADIPEKDRGFITVELYRNILEQVYRPFYYKHLTENDYWDRAALIRQLNARWEAEERAAQHGDEAPPPRPHQRTVIICDEAQDYTRLELHFLFKLNRFSNYDLRGFENLPIAFAGDPFQTVNPTGFSLVNVKRLFYDQLKQTFNITPDGDTLHYNLLNNYRSAPEVVRLANAVQGFRYHYLRQRELRAAQRPMRTGVSHDVLALDTSTFEYDEKFHNKIIAAQMLLPCDDGAEAIFVNDDPWLPFTVAPGAERGKENYHYRDGTPSAFNALSAAAFKGEEQGSIVLYGFGEWLSREISPRLFDRILRGEQRVDDLSLGERFKLIYFFNKVYVAITRAVDQLIILDTPRGLDMLWQMLRNFAERKDAAPGFDWRDRTPAGETSDTTSADHIRRRKRQLFKMARPADLLPPKLDQVLETAERLQSEGEKNRLPDRLRTAIRWYKRINTTGIHTQRILYCEARAEEFNRHYAVAATLYRDCEAGADGGNFDPHTVRGRCFYLGGMWQELLTHYADDDGDEAIARRAVARIMRGDTDYDFRTFADARVDIQIDQPEGVVPVWWSDFLDRLPQRILQNQTVIPTDYFGRLGETLDEFSAENSDFQPDDLIANLLYLGARYVGCREKLRELEPLSEDRQLLRLQAERHLRPRWDAQLPLLFQLRRLLHKAPYLRKRFIRPNEVPTLRDLQKTILKMLDENSWINGKLESDALQHLIRTREWNYLAKHLADERLNPSRFYRAATKDVPAAEQGETVYQVIWQLFYTAKDRKTRRKIAEKWTPYVWKTTKQVADPKGKQAGKTIKANAWKQHLADAGIARLAVLMLRLTAHGPDQNYRQSAEVVQLLNALVLLWDHSHPQTARRRARLTAPELSAAIDRLVPEAIQRTDYYVAHNGVLLRDASLTPPERTFLLRQFWRLYHLHWISGSLATPNLEDKIFKVYRTVFRERKFQLPPFAYDADADYFRELRGFGNPEALPNEVAVAEAAQPSRVYQRFERKVVQVKSPKEKLREARQQLEESRTQVAQLRVKLRDLQRQTETLQRELKTAEEDRRTKLEEERKINQDLRTDLNDLRRELNHLKRELGREVD